MKRRLDEFMWNSFGFFFITFLLEILVFIFYSVVKTNYEIPFLFHYVLFFYLFIIAVFNSVFCLVLDYFFSKNSDSDYLSYFPSVIVFFCLVLVGFGEHNLELYFIATFVGITISNHFRFTRIRSQRANNII